MEQTDLLLERIVRVGETEIDQAYDLLVDGVEGIGCVGDLIANDAHERKVFEN